MTQVDARPTPAPEPRVDGLAARVRLGRVFRPVSTEFALIASTSLLLTVFGLVMIVMMVWRPQGLLPMKRHHVEVT